MTDGLKIILVDSVTAATLAQILPVLLLTLSAELRRTRYRGNPRLLALFFFIFGVIETTLVLSIDGAFYPFQWFDSMVGITIFGLLAIIFRLSLAEPKSQYEDEDEDSGYI